MAWSKRIESRKPATTEGHLFILGAARSGTTVLQNALNDSPDIFLLGEPDLLMDSAPGFAARYNARHRAWGNQETKSSFCPPLIDQDGTWKDYFQALDRRYRWVGAKLVLNPIRSSTALHDLFSFHCFHFYSARYIFTFRDPLATVLSTRDLQMLSQGRSDGVRAIMRNTVDMFGLYIRMVRNLPHVRAVFHEQIGAGTFAELEQWLGTSLGGAAAYYDSERVRSYDSVQLAPNERKLMHVIQQLYSDLRDGVNAGFRTPQLEQNDQHLSPKHYTLLGSIDRRARTIAEHLAS